MSQMSSGFCGIHWSRSVCKDFKPDSFLSPFLQIGQFAVNKCIWKSLLWFFYTEPEFGFDTHWSSPETSPGSLWTPCQWRTSACPLSYAFAFLAASSDRSMQSRAQTGNSCLTVKYLVTGLQQDYRTLHTARALRNDLCNRRCPSLLAVFIHEGHTCELNSTLQ